MTSPNGFDDVDVGVYMRNMHDACHSAVSLYSASLAGQLNFDARPAIVHIWVSYLKATKVVGKNSSSVSHRHRRSLARLWPENLNELSSNVANRARG